MTSIVVNLQMEGLHCWPEAAEKLPSVGYLADLHRHIFHITCVKRVTHTDRDIEIIMFKQAITAYLKEQFYSKKYGCLNFERRSCEDLAQLLCSTFNLKDCSVLEDGENGAVINDYQPPTTISSTPRVVFICGMICSGKTTLAKRLQGADPLAQYIEISDIVKKAKNTTERSKLQDTIELDVVIINTLKQAIADAAGKVNTIFISGARQVSIAKQFSQAEFIWLHTPTFIRFNRFVNRDDTKDVDRTREAFDLAETRDRRLGIYRLKQHILNLQTDE